MAVQAQRISPPLDVPLPYATWVEATIPQARRLSEDELAATVTEAYGAVREQLSGLSIVRMWNYIPGITDPLGPGRDRYMAFNAGRYAAMSTWFGGPEQLLANAPAASGVGASGDDLIIHALALPQPGVSVQNPWQTPAVDYSQKFGPRPPCFARATRVGDLLLVSGTAAIRGEESVAGDLAGQLRTTLENLAVLPHGGLRAYRSLRVFLPDVTHRADVGAKLLAATARGCDMSFVHAALCRRELLVEIEGIANESRPHGGTI